MMSTRLYLTDASGSEPRLVDTGCGASCFRDGTVCVAPCFGESDAAFSSDGKRLVFVRTVAGARGGAGSVLATVVLLTGDVVELASTRISALSGDFQGATPQHYHPRWASKGGPGTMRRRTSSARPQD